MEEELFKEGELEVLSKRVEELENQIASINPRNLSGLTQALIAAAVIRKSYTAGEAIGANKCVYIEDSSAATNTLVSNTGTSSDGCLMGVVTQTGNQAEKVAQSFVFPYEVYLSAIKVVIYKVSSPGDNAVLALQKDSGSNEPDGTDIATVSVSGAGLPTGSDTLTTFTFSAVQTLTAGQRYWFVMRRSGALTDANSYDVRNSGSSGYSDGVAKVLQSSVWNSIGNILDAGFQIQEASQSGKIYLANSGTTGKYESAVGFSVGSIGRGQSGTIQIGGEMSGFSGLTTGVVYYVSTSGAITSTAGAPNRKIGIATSATTLLILNII